MFSKLLQSVASSSFGRHRRSKFVNVKLRVSPRYIAVFDVVWNAVIVKWAEVSAFNSVANVGLKYKILLTQCQQIRSIRTIWCCC